jgi:4-hydroxy-tetrahydrodipicolinate synthase
MSAQRVLQGVIIPLTTPFDADGEIDEKAFQAQIEWMISQGVHGVVVGGSTGEGYALAKKELIHLVRLALDVTQTRIPVLASIIADSTRDAVSRARALRDLPVAALQVAPPHYIFSPSDEGLIAFYTAVAEASATPVIVYNVVSWANVDASLAVRIMEAASGVIAIKQSDKNFPAYVNLVGAIGSQRVFAAIDNGLMSCYDLGAAGSIAAIASAAPAANVRLWNAVRAGRRDEALALHGKLATLWATLTAPNLPARVKAAQMLQGIPHNYPRSPMDAAGDGERERIRQALASLAQD